MALSIILKGDGHLRRTERQQIDHVGEGQIFGRRLLIHSLENLFGGRHGRVFAAFHARNAGQSGQVRIASAAGIEISMRANSDGSDIEKRWRLESMSTVGSDLIQRSLQQGRADGSEQDRSSHRRSEFCEDALPVFGCKPSHERDVLVEERLADRIALVVVPAAGENEEFGFEVGQPRRPFWQQGLARFKHCRGDRHPARLIPFCPNGDNPRDPPFQLLNKRGPGAGVLDQNAPGVPLSEGYGADAPSVGSL
jgi:hypothetical protein